MLVVDGSERLIVTGADARQSSASPSLNVTRRPTRTTFTGRG